MRNGLKLALLGPFYFAAPLARGIQFALTLRTDKPKDT
jgi:hypothetical protein